ncbi:MAG: hypothetical protein ACRDMY_15560, partial [Gaiellaceae bacterium]
MAEMVAGGSVGVVYRGVTVSAMILGVSGSGGVDWTDFIVIGVALGALAVAALQFRLANHALRRTSQPVVVVHEVETRLELGHDRVGYRVYLENVGVGAAFNVRFGVVVGRTSYPYIFGDSEERGARQLVKAGGRVPEEGDREIPVSWAPFALEGATADSGRVYWARYENAFGETYETRNPTDPSLD